VFSGATKAIVVVADATVFRDPDKQVFPVVLAHCCHIWEEAVHRVTTKSL